MRNEEIINRVIFRKSIKDNRLMIIPHRVYAAIKDNIECSLIFIVTLAIESALTDRMKKSF